MADTTTTTNHSLFPLETCPQVADEAFRQFHTIDRELFALLAHGLRRDPAESVHVMGFLIWLERECSKNLIKRMTAAPSLLLNQLANEAALCVKCVESDAFLFGGDGVNEINILSEFVKLPEGVGLRFFHENRIAVLRGVLKIVNTICWRAFGDLFHPTLGEVAAPPPPLHAMQQFRYNPYLDVLPVVPLPSAVAGGVLGMPPHRPEALGLPPHLMAAQRQMLGGELGDLMRRNLNLNLENENQEVEVAPDDRTIFLTFSKGYPTSEDEVKEFFTRKFGDFIEDLIMKPREEGEQPLFAKMVVRTPAVIPAIVEGGVVDGTKAKYSINGKHVWARKYVKKPPQQRSPPRGEGSGEGSGSSPAKQA